MGVKTEVDQMVRKNASGRASRVAGIENDWNSSSGDISSGDTILISK